MDEFTTPEEAEAELSPLLLELIASGDAGRIASAVYDLEWDEVNVLAVLAICDLAVIRRQMIAGMN